MTEEELMEFEADIKAFANSKSVHILLDQMMAEYVDAMVQAPVGDLTAVTAHASMKSLTEFKLRLEQIGKSEETRSVIAKRKRNAGS